MLPFCEGHIFLYFARYAQRASGEVSAFVDGSRPTSVFNRVELPTLQANPSVTKIIYSPEIYVSPSLVP